MTHDCKTEVAEVPEATNPQSPMSQNEQQRITVFLEPTKRKVGVNVSENARVGEVVQGMVTHLQATGAEQGFDLNVYLRDTIGEGFSPEWQLFRERENMQLLPPGARFGDIQPPLEPDEEFTVKVNAKVAADKPNQMYEFLRFPFSFGLEHGQVWTHSSITSVAAPEKLTLPKSRSFGQLDDSASLALNRVACHR